MKYWEIIADKLSAAGWSWGIAAPLPAVGGVGSLTPIAKVDATLANKSELAVRSFRLFLEGML